MTSGKFDLQGQVTSCRFEEPASGASYAVLVSAQGYKVPDTGPKTLASTARFEVTMTQVKGKWLASDCNRSGSGMSDPTEPDGPPQRRNCGRLSRRPTGPRGGRRRRRATAASRARRIGGRADAWPARPDSPAGQPDGPGKRHGARRAPRRRARRPRARRRKTGPGSAPTRTGPASARRALGRAARALMPWLLSRLSVSARRGRVAQSRSVVGQSGTGACATRSASRCWPRRRPASRRSCLRLPQAAAAEAAGQACSTGQLAVRATRKPMDTHGQADRPAEQTSCRRSRSRRPASVGQCGRQAVGRRCLSASSR